MRNAIFTAIALCSLGFPLPAQVDRVPAGTEIVVRTNDAIDAKHPSDSRIYSGVIDRDVMDRSGRVMIPRGSNAELIMRDTDNDQITVDLEAVEVNGQRFAVDAASETITAAEGERKEGVGKNKRTGQYVGGGAAIGAIIGAIAGGGKGAAIGAATGAAAGAAGQTVTRGGSVRLPSESLLTFRLDRALRVGVTDSGYMREGRHYHRYDNYDNTRSRQR